MKPILFNTEMVCATLDGRKTATRRLVKPCHLKVLSSQYHREHPEISQKQLIEKLCKPPFSPGDILYVREKFACDGFDGREYHYVYWTDVDDCGRVVWGDLEEGEWAPISDYNWHPSIHMPKEAARIFLRVTDVRVERLQEITDEGARKEGIGEFFVGMGESGFAVSHDSKTFYEGPIGAFVKLWNRTVELSKREIYGWAANPWVWVIEFERCEKPKEERE